MLQYNKALGEFQEKSDPDGIQYRGWTVIPMGAHVVNPYTGERKFFNTMKETKQYIDGYMGGKRRPKQ